MCGIAGYYSVEGSNQSQLKLAAAILGIEMQSRGGQSFGTLDSEGTIVKGLGPISAGITLPLVMPRAYVIHTRFGTHGLNTLENAHPFTQGNIIGVHNGVIGNHWELNDKYARDFAVDSQHIFQHINDGLVDLADIQGYGAIVYSYEGNWFAGTFNQGQLEIANTALGKIYASTRIAVEKACRFAGIEILSWDLLNDNTIYELHPTDTFKRFEVKPGSTTSKWEDGEMGRWWETLSKKNSESLEGKIIRSWHYSGKFLPAPKDGVEIEEHDESSTGLQCEHCYGDVLPEMYYKNLEGLIVCSDCAKTSYAFIAPDEYYKNENKGRFNVECGLCGSIHMEPIVNLTTEDLMICNDCFECFYNTKGLVKITPALVH